VVGLEVALDTVLKVKGVLEEESPMPLFFDVLHLDRLLDSRLKAEILGRGKVIYER